MIRHPSRIELSRQALAKNIRYLRKRVGADTRFVSVIKGNAYGHGINIFVPLAESCGIRHFAVFDAYEASRVLPVKQPDTDLTVMGMIDNGDLEWAVEHGISFYVFENERLERAVAAARKVGRPARIHLELETGLNRTGYKDEALDRAVELIRLNGDTLELEGICTHYAGAESVANYLRVREQIDTFKRLVAELESRGIRARYRHTACSAAALNYPETIMDMVRIGIAHYGFWPTQETKMYNCLSGDNHFTQDPLHPVLSWKSRVMSTTRVPAGRFVGYGTSYMTTRDELLAAIPVGYSHGYSRSLSNLGTVLIRGRKAPVVGMVNMNMLLVKINHVPGVEKGDEVVLIGRQGKQNITVASFADLSRHVNYELLTRLPQDIPRVVTD